MTVAENTSFEGVRSAERVQPWKKIQKLNNRRPTDLEDVQGAERFYVNGGVRVLDERFNSAAPCEKADDGSSH